MQRIFLIGNLFIFQQGLCFVGDGAGRIDAGEQVFDGCGVSAVGGGCYVDGGVRESDDAEDSLVAAAVVADTFRLGAGDFQGVFVFQSSGFFGKLFPALSQKVVIGVCDLEHNCSIVKGIAPDNADGIFLDHVRSFPGVAVVDQRDAIVTLVFGIDGVFGDDLVTAEDVIKGICNTAAA